mmetsp:Transcript_13829/g.48193  ORF Transcript_13829/g.48193 Transcript_13829/m.48193 type:complete len:327 (-) Transcript_13829:1072-2052(-)
MAASGSGSGDGGGNAGAGKFEYGGRVVEIRDVWAGNLDEEMARIRDVVEDYPYIAMDTEFPGVVARPIGSFSSNAAFNYATLRVNCDVLRLIQVGVTFCNARGEPAEPCATWQFNMRFSLDTDMYAADSIELLQRSGIDFARHAAEGIDVHRFGELLMTSGLVLNDDVCWVSFHSGYDFGYLLRVLTCAPLPSEEEAFFALLRAFFPGVYDEKHLMHALSSGGVASSSSADRDARFVGGLNRLAADLGVDRVGPKHQAGSDSLVTARTFFRLRDEYLGGGSMEERERERARERDRAGGGAASGKGAAGATPLLGVLYGLGKGYADR